MTEKTNIVSLSGGRTSGYMAYLMKSLCDKSGEPVEYVFCDTGAEHPKTYDFIRSIANNFGIKITCLRPVFSEVIGVGVEYSVVDINEIGYDLSIFKSMMAAYGAPYNPGGGMCTDKLKTVAFAKYCNEVHGKGNYYTWIGYRSDEAKRAWGHKLYTRLIQYGFDSETSGELMVDALAQSDLAGFFELRLGIDGDLFGDNEEEHGLVDNLKAKIATVKKRDFRFMFEIVDADKAAVNKWWSQQSFDLDIPDYLGNCVFCIKKPESRLALAAMDEPKMADEWQALFHCDSVRDMKRQAGNHIIYRGYNSLDSIRELYKGVDRQEIIARMRHAPSGTAESCSESCSAYSDQMDWIDDAREKGY